MLSPGTTSSSKMQEKDSKPASQNPSGSAVNPTPRVTAVKTAQKPSEAILMGIDKFIGETLPVVQGSVVAAHEDSEGRARAVTFLK